MIMKISFLFIISEISTEAKDSQHLSAGAFSLTQQDHTPCVKQGKAETLTVIYYVRGTQLVHSLQLIVVVISLGFASMYTCTPT